MVSFVGQLSQRKTGPKIWLLALGIFVEVMQPREKKSQPFVALSVWDFTMPIIPTITKVRQV